MDDLAQAVASRIAHRFAHLPEVEAVAVAGSQASGAASVGSDIDIYIYSTQEIPAETRLKIGAEFSDDCVLNDFWGAGNEWTDRDSGIHIDAMFWETDWFEDQIGRVLDRHQPSLGYSTCFWYTLKISQIQFNRSGWFARLQERAQQPYPEALAQAIIAHNLPTLRSLPSAYRTQIAKAASRGDRVSLNHRTAALLASYFDILFALNRIPHPGEKRLIDLAEKGCPKRPAALRAEVESLIEASATGDPAIVERVDRLLDGLDAVLKAENLP